MFSQIGVSDKKKLKRFFVYFKSPHAMVMYNNIIYHVYITYCISVCVCVCVCLSTTRMGPGGPFEYLYDY